MVNKRYCFDLDGVIAVEDKSKPYFQRAPVKEVVKLINDLKEQGGYIIIHTARGMLSRQNNIGKINAELGTVTANWLEKNGVDYDELHFGKPYADYYIDDKAVNGGSVSEIKKALGHYNWR